MKGADGVCIAGVPMHIAGLKAARSLGRTRNRRQMWVVRSQRVDNEGDPSESSASRRHLLIGTGSTTGLLLSGQAAHSGTDPLSMYRTAPGGGAARKEGREAKFVMRITALRGSVPASWISDFATAMEGYGVVAMTQKPQIIDIWDELMGIKNASKKKNRDAFLTTDTNKANQTTVDAVTLGDAWLRAAIVKGLIQPIEDARDRRYWSYLSPRWRQLVCRNAAGEVDQAGKVWGIPYRWGCTVILYRRDTARRWGGAEGAVIKDWDDLLLPGLKNRVAFVDSPREFLGVAFKTLGLGYNATSSSMESCGVSELDVVARLKNLSQQMRVFSNVDHVRAFAAGEVDVIVGWSEDLLPLAERVPSAQIALPASGTALWADLWCVPTNSAGG
jgi:spermidine/putrescine-binding protein